MIIVIVGILKVDSVVASIIRITVAAFVCFVIVVAVRIICILDM